MEKSGWQPIREFGILKTIRSTLLTQPLCNIRFTKYPNSQKKINYGSALELLVQWYYKKTPSQKLKFLLQMMCSSKICFSHLKNMFLWHQQWACSTAKLKAQSWRFNQEKFTTTMP